MSWQGARLHCPFNSKGRETHGGRWTCRGSGTSNHTLQEPDGHGAVAHPPNLRCRTPDAGGSPGALRRRCGADPALRCLDRFLRGNRLRAARVGGPAATDATWGLQRFDEAPSFATLALLVRLLEEAVHRPAGFAGQVRQRAALFSGRAKPVQADRPRSVPYLRLVA